MADCKNVLPCTLCKLYETCSECFDPRVVWNSVALKEMLVDARDCDFFEMRED